MMTLICGVPNSGKSTQSRTMLNSYHISEFFVGSFDHQFVACNRHLSKLDGDFCVEGVYNTVKLRKDLLKACEHQDYKRCIFRDISLETCLAREDRGRSEKGLKEAYAKLEKPTLDEGWDEIITIHEDGTESVQKRI